MEKSRMKKFVNHTCAVVAMKAMNLRQKLAEQRAEGYVAVSYTHLIIHASVSP